MSSRNETKTRRGFLQSGVMATAGGLLVSWAWPLAAVARRGTFLGNVPFVGDGRAALGQVTGSGLGGRLALDLSKLTPETLVTSNEDFFIRTRYPDELRPSLPWKIAVRGLVEAPSSVTAEELSQQEEPMGAHLLECSGNGRHRAFGLMSAAESSGVPVSKILKRIAIRPEARRVLISGFDGHSKPHRGSSPGANWIFTFQELEAQGAFLATKMNGEPLPKDHGHPVRLIVPGWYGCTCIKWVNEIVLLDDEARATEQMKEFAGRTHQDGVPELAREFKPAKMDQAAMPIRVETWRVDGNLEYRVVGILWGGDRPTDALEVRFGPESAFVPVGDYRHKGNSTWTLWSHAFRPKSPGKYRIECRIADPSIRTRGLDRRFYARTVRIDEV